MFLCVHRDLYFGNFNFIVIFQLIQCYKIQRCRHGDIIINLIETLNVSERLGEDGAAMFAKLENLIESRYSNSESWEFQRILDSSSGCLNNVSFLINKIIHSNETAMTLMRFIVRWWFRVQRHVLHATIDPSKISCSKFVFACISFLMTPGIEMIRYHFEYVVRHLLIYAVQYIAPNSFWMRALFLSFFRVCFLLLLWVCGGASLGRCKCKNITLLLLVSPKLYSFWYVYVGNHLPFSFVF